MLCDRSPYHCQLGVRWGLHQKAVKPQVGSGWTENQAAASASPRLRQSEQGRLTPTVPVLSWSNILRKQASFSVLCSSLSLWRALWRQNKPIRSLFLPILFLFLFFASRREMEAGSRIGESTDAIVMDDSPTDERGMQDGCQRWGFISLPLFHLLCFTV